MPSLRGRVGRAAQPAPAEGLKKGGQPQAGTTVESQHRGSPFRMPRPSPAGRGREVARRGAPSFLPPRGGRKRRSGGGWTSRGARREGCRTEEPARRAQLSRWKSSCPRKYTDHSGGLSVCLIQWAVSLALTRKGILPKRARFVSCRQSQATDWSVVLAGGRTRTAGLLLREAGQPLALDVTRRRPRRRRRHQHTQARAAAPSPGLRGRAPPDL